MAAPERVSGRKWNIINETTTTERSVSPETRYTEAVTHGFALQEVFAKHRSGIYLSPGELHHLGISASQLNLPFVTGAFQVAAWMAEVVAARNVGRDLPPVAVDTPFLQQNLPTTYHRVLEDGITFSALQADVAEVKRSLRSDPTGIRWLNDHLHGLANNPDVAPKEIEGAYHGIRRVASLVPHTSLLR